MGIKSKTLNKEISTVQKTISARNIVRKVKKARFLFANSYQRTVTEQPEEDEAEVFSCCFFGVHEP